MAKNSKQDRKEKEEKYSKENNRSNKKRNDEGGLKHETKYGIYALIAFLVAFFFILSGFGGAGPSGRVIHSLFSTLFGVGYWLVPILSVLLGASYLKSIRPNIGLSHMVSSLIFLLSGLGIIDIATSTHQGGVVGSIVSFPFLKLFDTLFSVLFLVCLLVISILILFDARLGFTNIADAIRTLFGKKRKEKNVLDDDEVKKIEDKIKSDMPTEEISKETIREKVAKVVGMDKGSDDEEFELGRRKMLQDENYIAPPLTLLERDRGKADVGDIKSNSNIIKRTLANFGIEVEMDEITIGPSVTRYALKPAEGVKLSRIVGLQSDLALALAAHPIRIEAPIPGKSLVVLKFQTE
jgi:S-DNA-T family DNA segregation ATPase FtsK/SpoIIIE